MPTTKNHKAIALTFAIALGLALLVYVSWQPDQGEPDNIPPDPVAEAGDDEPMAPELAESELMDPPTVSRRTTAIGKTEASRIQKLVATQEPFPHDVLMDDYKRELWSEIETNPPPLRQPGDPALDAEMAYRLYMFFGNCSIAPRTEQQVDERLAQINRRAENATDRILDRLEQNANQLLDYYELCMSIPADVDCRLEAVNWMSEAVRLGHEIAQVQFYEKAMGFLLRPDRWSDRPPLVMLHPGIVEEFQATARFALRQAMEKGHPEAYLAMAEAIDEGILYPADPVLAYAYVRAAESRAAKSQIILERIWQTKSDLAEKLDPALKAEAEQLAMELQMQHGTG